VATGNFLLDLNMMLVPGGSERTEAEYRDLITAAGLSLVSIITTPGTSAIIETGCASS
jgi:O-methyltransferase domain